MTNKTQTKLNKGDVVYLARAFETVGIFDVWELKINTVAVGYYVGIEKHDKTAYLFPEKDIGVTVFQNRKEALDVVLAAEDRYRERQKEEKGKNYE